MKLILAADRNWAIGNKGDLLCHISGDLKYFKKRTQGKTVIMGRKTLESLPGGKPLPDRRNIVLTTDSSYKKDGIETVQSVEELLELTKSADAGELMVIGGGKVYEEMLPYCDTCYITKIDREFEADTYFTDLDRDENFEVVWQDGPYEDKGISYTFYEYRRK